MGRFRKKRHQHQISAKQKRKAKLTKLRQAYSETKAKEKKDQILKKVSKVSPWLSKEEFTVSIKRDKKES